MNAIILSKIMQEKFPRFGVYGAPVTERQRKAVRMIHRLYKRTIRARTANQSPIGCDIRPNGSMIQL